MLPENKKLIPKEPQRFGSNDLDILLCFCSQLEASDITFQSGMPVFSEIHGKLYQNTRRSITNAEVGVILNHIYGPNGTAQLLTGVDIDTNYEVRPDRMTRLRFRVNATACLVDSHSAIQITLRSIPTTPPFLKTMQIDDNLDKSLRPNDGIIYITGATGSGKSTLLASIIRDIAEDPDCNRKILTYESPIEFVYDELNTKSAIISQSEIPLHIPSFAAGVRNALRRKPKLILVGESRDAETIAASLEAALTGHPVYTTLHTNGVAETIRRLVGSFPQAERDGRTIDIIETCRVIVWQHLVPSIDNKRVALREYLVFNKDVRDVLLKCTPDNVTEKTRDLLNEYGQPMLKDAQNKLDQGVISTDVFNKVTNL